MQGFRSYHRQTAARVAAAGESPQLIDHGRLIHAWWASLSADEFARQTLAELERIDRELGIERHAGPKGGNQ
jgi:acetyl esterase/lipase